MTVAELLEVLKKVDPSKPVIRFDEKIGRIEIETVHDWPSSVELV